MGTTAVATTASTFTINIFFARKNVMGTTAVASTASTFSKNIFCFGCERSPSDLSGSYRYFFLMGTTAVASTASTFSITFWVSWAVRWCTPTRISERYIVRPDECSNHHRSFVWTSSARNIWSELVGATARTFTDI